jgi:preprotein translocase subunit SecY
MLFPDVNPNFFTIYSVMILTAGTMFCMWLGEKITEKGIGNGISLLIMVGIISRLPASVIAEFMQKGGDGLLLIVIEFVALFFIVMLTVMITQAVRRIPISYAKQVVGNKVYGGQRQYLPLKVNAAGVMPIIFAQALMFLPSMIAGSIGDGTNKIAIAISRAFSTPTSWEYNTMSAIMIVLFTYFYTAITIQPNQIADDLKRNGGFVPGIKPGLATGEYIDTILSRITLPGALLIALIAIMPAFAMMGGVNPQFAQFFGGTSLLILVGVILDTLQQIESYLLMRQYDGMMKSGKVKGRPSNMSMA